MKRRGFLGAVIGVLAAPFAVKAIAKSDPAKREMKFVYGVLTEDQDTHPWQARVVPFEQARKFALESELRRGGFAPGALAAFPRHDLADGEGEIVTLRTFLPKDCAEAGLRLTAIWDARRNRYEMLSLMCPPDEP